MDAELDLGQPDARRRIARGDAIAAGERDLGAAAHAGAVDRGDGRAGQAASFCNTRWPFSMFVEHAAAVRVALEFLEVGADDETGALPERITTPLGGSNDRRSTISASSSMTARLSALTVLAGAVEGQHDDAVASRTGCQCWKRKPSNMAGSGKS